MKKILVIQPIQREALALLEARSDISFEIATDVSEANLLRLVGEVDAITIRDAPLPRSVIDAAPRLKVVSRHGVGTDNIPVDVCTANAIPVAVVGPVNAVSVAEHTLFLILAAARVGMALDAAVRAGDFGARSRLQGIELKGRRLLVIGFGRIGREVATRAAAFGMKVAAFDPLLVDPPNDPAIERVDDLTAALGAADVVTLHVPLTEATRRMIGATELALMPEGAILVNASRGGLVDEAALLAAVRSRHLAGAGLDTFEREPLPADSPLLGERRIVLSPHAAALTQEALLAMGLATVKNALAGLDGTLDPDLVVNRSVLGRNVDASE